MENINRKKNDLTTEQTEHTEERKANSGRGKYNLTANGHEWT